MTSNILTEFSSYPIVAERITNLNREHIDLVHCPICGYILYKPVTCSLCENSFCFQCIQIWLFEQEKQIIEYINYDNNNDYLIKSLTLIRCPFYCTPYKQRKCLPLLTTILSKLIIECQNKLYGCQEILFYEQLENHEENLCPYKIIQCTGCKKNMFKSIYDKDEHSLKCLDINIQCKICESIFKRKDHHNQFDCMEKQFCLLKQNVKIFEEKCSKIFDIQRKRIEILNEKITIIGDILSRDEDTNDDQQQIDSKKDSILLSTQLLKFKFLKKRVVVIWLIIFFIFLLIIFTVIFL